VKQKDRNMRWQILQAFFGLMVIGLMVSACSLTGNSSSSTSDTSSSSASPSSASSSGVTPVSTHPVASTPPVSGTPTGQPVPGNQVMPLVFNLVYNDAAMNRDVLQMYTPGSPTFHQFLTPQQIVQRYAPSNAQVQEVTDWLTQNGYTIVSTDALHSSIKVQATVANVEKSLHVTFAYHTLLGRQFFTHNGNPTLPANINGLVQSIIGLDDSAFPFFRPPFISKQTGTLAADCSGYGAQQTLTRDKLAAAYQINQLYQQGYQGQGMTIGVAEFDEPYDPADIASYAACVGLPTPNIQNVDVDGHLASGSGEGEAALDLELITGLAPKAQILDYQADLQDTNTTFAQGLVDVFNRVAVDHKVQVLSVSYGSAESSFSTSELQAVNNSLRTLAAEGISVLISSGDCGAFSERLHNFATASFPASAPYAIAVGGTYLQVNNNNARSSEVAWGDDDHALVCQNEWGSGGGVSENPNFTRPSWQVGSGTTTQYNGLQAIPPVTIAGSPQPVSAPNGLRQVPDIAAAAYPNIAIYYKGAWLASGGTSAAAPIWAAGLLLVDQALTQHSKPLFGGVPEIYTLANHPNGHHPFNDITSGNNLFYTATPGWDYVTGWGSPNFNDILQIELAE